jgi:diguanylate cyclase (GGDEF)-like protein
MAEPLSVSHHNALAELANAVAADAGAALYLDDGDGTLKLSTRVGGPSSRPPNLLRRLSRREQGQDEPTLVLNVPGTPSGLLILAREAGADDFTQQDTTLARLYLNRLSDRDSRSMPAAGSPWTRQLEAIQRIAGRLSKLASVEEVATTICTETSAVIDYNEAHVLLIDESGGLQRIAAIAAGKGASGSVPPVPSSERAAAAMSRALSRGVPGVVDLSDAEPERSGIHSLLVVPLQYESNVNGLICLIGEGAARFGDSDLRLLQILSGQAAVALANARLLQGRDELVHELAGLLEISEAAGTYSDEARLAALVAARLREATATDAALVSRWDEGSTMLDVLARDGASGASTAIDVADSPARRAVLRDGRPVVIQSLSSDAGVDATQLRHIGGQSLILLPLSAGGRTIGMVELVAMREAREPNPSELHTYEAMAGLAASGLERMRVVEELRSAADVDLVTGVHNHRYLQERLRQEVARSARSHTPVAVLMLDLNSFKNINDRHGHGEGDRVLHAIGSTIKSQVRASDIVARYGGDEFVVLMPDTADGRAEAVARRIANAVMKREHELSDGTRVTVGVSAGLALYPTDGRTPAKLLAAADTQMYLAKRNGGGLVGRTDGPPLIDASAATATAAV